MQKLSVTVLERMLKSNLSGKEVDFILYVGRYQNEYGTAEGIYYKDICHAVNVSIQGFYDCKKSLEKKGIISCTKNSYYDCDVTILDNSFAGKENYGRGYVSLHCKMVRSPEFSKLKAGARLMGLWLMREWMINKSKTKKSSYQMLKKTFIDKFTKLMDISPRTVRAYLGMLDPFMSVYLEKAKKYFFTFKNDAIAAIDAYENDELRKHTVKIACRRNRIVDQDEEKVSEICGILSQQNKRLKKVLISLSNVIKSSLELINQDVRNKYKWKRFLSPSLIHKILIQELQAREVVAGIM